MSAERENFAQNPSRRAIFKAAPAIAAASAVSVPAVVAATTATAMEWSYKFFVEASDIMDAMDDDAVEDAEWEEKVGAARNARASICRTPCRTENDLWLKVSAVLRSAGGLHGIADQIDGRLREGGAYSHTMALSVIADLVALRSKLVF